MLSINKSIMLSIQAKKYKNKEQIFKQTKIFICSPNSKFLIKLSTVSVGNVKTLKFAVLFLIVDKKVLQKCLYQKIN